MTLHWFTHMNICLRIFTYYLVARFVLGVWLKLNAFRLFWKINDTHIRLGRPIRVPYSFLPSVWKYTLALGRFRIDPMVDYQRTRQAQVLTMKYGEGIKQHYVPEVYIRYYKEQKSFFWRVFNVIK